MPAQTVQGIRDYIRSYLDLDETDLSDTLIDAWMNEGFQMMAVGEPQWPYYEYTWTFTTTVGQQNYTISTEIGTTDVPVRRIVAIVGDRGPLQWLGEDEVSARWTLTNSTSDTTAYWSEWGYDTIRLHPSPSAAETLTVRGYRQPSDWISEGAGGVPDIPEELHPCLVSFVLSRAYFQQEDQELANSNMRIFEESLEMFKRRLNDIPSGQPIILNGRHFYGPQEAVITTPLFGFDGR